MPRARCETRVWNACAHGFGFEVINDVHVQLNGYLLARRLLPKGPSFRANRRYSVVGNSIFFLSFLMHCFDLVLCCKEEPIQWYRFLRVQQLQRSGRLDHRISSICPNLHPFFQQLLSLGGLFGAFERLECLERCAAANRNKLERVFYYRVGISP